MRRAIMHWIRGLFSAREHRPIASPVGNVPAMPGPETFTCTVLENQMGEVEENPTVPVVAMEDVCALAVREFRAMNPCLDPTPEGYNWTLTHVFVAIIDRRLYCTACGREFGGREGGVPNHLILEA